MSAAEQAVRTEQTNNSNKHKNNEASSSKPTADNKSKPNKKHYKGRGKKKNDNVVNATEAGTPQPTKPETSETKPVSAKPSEKDESKPQKKRNNNRRKPKSTENTEGSTAPAALITKDRAQGRLTETQDDTASTSSKSQNKKSNNNRPRNRNRQPKLSAGEHDMSTILAHELKTSTYECMICMDTVRPAHHVWTCDCCWAVFHLNCVQTWASRSLKDTSSNKMITGWRCPGCQNSRTVIPKDYFCFCGKQRNPETSRYHTPHSCDQLCKRHKNCPHECVLPCHPGPCPPCSLMGPVLTCFCGRESRQTRCTETDYSTKGFSCNEVCDELLGCGKHRCEKSCHQGLCPPCELEEVQSCYCGRHERTSRCGSGKQVQLRGHIGYYSCGEKCDTVYDCGQHRCQKACHPCSANSLPCPFDPSAVKTCPCGNRTVSELLNGNERTSCTDAIPTCESNCNKIGVCGHPCEEKCHLGDCPPCQMTVKVPCRCQSTSFEDICSNVCEKAGGEPPLCDRVCKAIRNCGRHQCGTSCCPAMKVNGKRQPGTEHLHDCPLKCDQLLSCGQHHCQDMCHKGKCLPCLEATFDEITCHCGRTRLEPPIRCGTKLPPCPHPCIRPNPCGHMRFLNHNCHPDDEPCPPCPALVSRHCLCGKTELKNVPCYRESPRCGRVCGKQLPCGKHTCLKTCHNGSCLAEDEACTQVCTGTRNNCGHPCQQKCHQGSCPESEPCTTRVKASCNCGQNTMEITCKATADTKGAKKDLECNDFCAKVSRNRRLALALDIQRDSYAPPSSPALSIYSDKPLSTDDLGYYDETLCDFYKQNAVWCRHMEITLIEFVQNKEKKTFHFKPMRKEYRRFLHRYAIHFNLATEAIDAEPNRSIIMRKSLGNCRIPPILLSKAARNPTLNRPPPTLQALEADANSRSPLRQPVNALYLSDMAFGLTKIELDAELVPLMKIGNDTIPFTSTWVNENDAIVVPSISDSVSMDEKEQIIWQLKKSVKAAFVLSNESSKAARIDCCWVNQKGEVTWSEKMASQPKKEESSTTTTNSKKSFVNSFDALNTVDDDGWMKVGGNNPYKPVRDAWFDSPKSSAASLSVTKDENEEDEIVEIKTEEAEPESTNPIETKDESKNSTPLSDDWEALLDEDEA